MTPLAIALLSYSTKPRGSVVHTLSLAEALAEMGQKVTVWTLGRGGDCAFFRPVDPRVTVRIAPFPEVAGETVGPRILRSIQVLRDTFDPTGYDVVHAQDCISANAAGRCIRTVHHIDHFSTPELAACTSAPSPILTRMCACRPPSRASCSTGGGSPPRSSPTAWTPPGSALRQAQPARPPGKRGDRAWAATCWPVGGIEPRKGSLELLEAYALLRAWMPDVRLVIASGETLFDYRNYRTCWEQRAAALGVEGLGVEPVVLGPVPHDALPALVAAAGVFAFPSIKEGFGLAAMEALAAEVPLVVSGLPVLREIFSGAARFANDPAELAAQLMAGLTENDPGAQEAGRALAARHTWSAAAHRHLKLYRLR